VKQCPLAAAFGAGDDQVQSGAYARPQELQCLASEDTLLDQVLGVSGYSFLRLVLWQIVHGFPVIVSEPRRQCNWRENGTGSSSPVPSGVVVP
jgi:hypothetical protein